MRASLPVIFSVLFLLTACTESREPDRWLHELMNTEKAFARAAADHGIREAFLTYLTEEAVVFRPGPQNGRSVYEQLPETQDLLEWEPIYGQVSALADMGYTTGPWTYTTSGSTEPAASGSYVSIWKKQENGDWLVVIDVGIEHSIPVANGYGRPHENGRDDSSPNDRQAISVEEGLKALFELEKRYAAAAFEKGILPAFEEYTADNVLLFREGVTPVINREAARQYLRRESGDISWTTAFADVSKSVDMGYTFGAITRTIPTGESHTKEESSFLHIWNKKRGQEWKVVLDITNPFPPRKSEETNQ